MNVLILGANSDTAYAIAKTFAERERANLWLASRNMELLHKRVQDIKIRYGVNAEALFFDALDYTFHKEFYDSISPKPDGVVVAFGIMGDHIRAQNDFTLAKNIFETNLIGAVSILEIVSSDFEKRGRGFIIVMSSVAGERGRKSNYIYGAAKGGLTTYLSGLRHRLDKSNVQVITVLPGFIRTKMTEHMKLPPILTALPDEIAMDVYKAFRKGKSVIYTKWFWKWIMFTIKLIPESLFKKLNV